MSTLPLFTDALDLLEALEEARVDFIIVGAHALAAHGIIRATGDLDVLVRPTHENAVRVHRALGTFGAPLAAHGVQVADFERPGTVYQLGLPPRRVDILTSISGVEFDEAWRSRLTASLAGRDAPVLGEEALIKNKLATGRDKDRLDVEALRRRR